MSSENIYTESESPIANSKGLHVCDVCQKTFTRSASVKRHYKIHTGDKPFICSVCNKTFSENADLVRHSSTHEKTRKLFECPFCQKLFLTRDGFSVHKKVHTGQGLHHCTICNKSFSKSSALDVHYKIHTGDKLFYCSVCNKSFTQKTNLTRHLRVHNIDCTPKKNIYSCEVCHLSFTTLSILITHQKSHIKKSISTSEENTDSLLQESEPKIHSVTTVIKTDRCAVPTNCESYGYKLVIDQETEAPVDKKSLITKVVTGSKVKKSGSKQRRPLCKLCERTFQSNAHLKRHYTVHTGDKPYMCPVCNKSFTTKEYLIVHRKTHEGTRQRFSCSFCQKTFISRVGLVVHKKSHTGQGMHHCPICNKSFSNTTALIHHCRVHTGEKPYPCITCQKEFSTKPALKRHLRIHNKKFSTPDTSKTENKTETS